MSVKALPWIIFWAGILAYAQSQGTGGISGTVVDGESGDGVRKAIVTLTLEGTPRQWATERTDGDGRFAFEGLPAGAYTLEADKGDEGRAVYGARSVRELGRPLTLAGGEKRAGIMLRFLRGATISGRVLDSDGDPVANANVMLLRRGRNMGAAALVNDRGAPSDDQGQYLVSNIDPGMYYLHASPQVFNRRPGSGQPILIDQYYGGTHDPQEASPVRVSSGDHLDNLDFHLTPELPVRIHGQVLGVPGEPQPKTEELSRFGRRGPAVQVTITPADGNAVQWFTATVAQAPDHRFEFADLPSASYRLEATLQSGDRSYGASQTVNVGPGASDVTLTLAPAVEIQGTLRVEGPSQKDPGQSISVMLEKPGQAPGRVQSVVGANGRFKLGPVIPGEWNLDVPNLASSYLKSARLGDQDVRFKTFEVGADNEASLNVVVSTRTSEVEGAVGGGSADAGRAGILIARTDQFHTFTRFYYAVQADAKGRFHAKGIAPGKYKVFALENISAGDFRSPEAADDLDALGETIELGEGATVETHPKLIPFERARKALP